MQMQEKITVSDEKERGFLSELFMLRLPTNLMSKNSRNETVGTRVCLYLPSDGNKRRRLEMWVKSLMGVKQRFDGEERPEVRPRWRRTT